MATLSRRSAGVGRGARHGVIMPRPMSRPTPGQATVGAQDASRRVVFTVPVEAPTTPLSVALTQLPRGEEMGAAPVELKKGLKQRHLTMIAMGGVIGAGLFVGSGTVIGGAGPAALPDLRDHRRADHPGDADARRDGHGQPVHRLLRRLRPERAGRLGRLLGRLALLVLLGDRDRLRGRRRSAR